MSKLQPVNIFYTPDSIEELQDHLAQYTGTDAVIAQTAAFMAWNLAARLTSTEETAADE